MKIRRIWIEVPKNYTKINRSNTCKNVDEVLKVALIKPFKRVEWVDVDQITDKGKLKEELSTH